MSRFSTRVMTKDLKIVKVEPVCYDNDGFVLCYVDEQGNLYFTANELCDLLKKEHNVINVCGDESISDEEFENSVMDLISDFE